MSKVHVLNAAREFAGNAAYVRAVWPNDVQNDSRGFYWENIDCDRFYFDTWEEAANDLATEAGVTEEERAKALGVF